MMKSKLPPLLFFVLTIHLLISVLLIVKPAVLPVPGLSEIYKVHVLPGPFFKDDAIIKSYTLGLSGKLNSLWTKPIRPVIDNLNTYRRTFNPTWLYRSRLERAMDKEMFSTCGLSAAVFKEDNRCNHFSDYFIDRYTPATVDSIRVLMITKTSQNFRIKSDTVSVTVFK